MMGLDGCLEHSHPLQCSLGWREENSEMVRMLESFGPGWKFWLSAVEMKVEYVGRFEELPRSTPLLPSLWAQSGKKKGG